MILTRTFSVSVSYDSEALDSYVEDGFAPSRVLQDGHVGVIADEIKSNLKDLNFVSTVTVSFTVVR